MDDTIYDVFDEITFDKFNKSNDKQKINQKYKILRKLGSGSSSDVYLAELLQYPVNIKKYVAIKFINISVMNKYEIKNIYREIKCLKTCDFAFINKYYEHFINYKNNNPNIIAIILEYANAGDMRNDIKKRRIEKNYFNNNEIGLILIQILFSIHYLHSKKLLHRDIKTHNIFLTSLGFVKIGDLGFCKIYDNDNSNSTFCGTPYYVAPEVWENQKYSEKSDMFSIGVVLYELITFTRPFDGDNLPDVRKQILNANVPQLPSNICEELKNIVLSLLSKNPHNRPKAFELLNTSFIKFIISGFLGIIHTIKNNTISLEEYGQIFFDVKTVTNDVTLKINANHNLLPVKYNDSKSTNFSELSEQYYNTDYENLNVLYESYVYINEKKRFIYLFIEENIVKFGISTSQDKKKYTHKNINSYDDVFEMPEYLYDPPKKYCFALSTIEGKRTIIQTESKEEQQKWVSHIQNYIYNY
jgi:serine/threonine protein kinase